MYQHNPDNWTLHAILLMKFPNILYNMNSQNTLNNIVIRSMHKSILRIKKQKNRPNRNEQKIIDRSIENLILRAH